MMSLLETLESLVRESKTDIFRSATELTQMRVFGAYLEQLSILTEAQRSVINVCIAARFVDKGGASK